MFLRVLSQTLQQPRWQRRKLLLQLSRLLQRRRHSSLQLAVSRLVSGIQLALHQRLRARSSPASDQGKKEEEGDVPPPRLP